MSLKERLQLKLNPAFYWRVALLFGCAVSAGMLVLLWLGGSGETTDALASGRRIIIRMSDGSFEKAPLPDDATPESPTGESATATPTAESATATPTATPTESPTATPTSQAEPEAPVPNSTAAVPLNPINDKLREKLSVGTLPIIGTDGTRPWRFYAKPYSLKGNHPMVAILITGLGQNKAVTTAAIKLPENVSLSFSPYAKDVATWSNSARATGHEVMLDLPLEPTNYPAADPGPYGLLAGKSIEDNASKLQWLLGRVQGYIGFSTPSNEAFSLNDTNFKAVLELINARGLMIVFPHEPVRKESRQTLDDTKIAYTLADVEIDEELSPEAIEARLTSLEKIASKRGFAVGYARALPITLSQLTTWTEKLEAHGYTLVPISYITSKKFKE